jgi:hypothetical protein
VRRILILLLEFVALSAPLTWLWLGWGLDAYIDLLFGLLQPIYRAFGGAHAGGTPAGHRYLSYVPFLVLMSITPGMALRRRLLAIAGGCVLLLLSHVLLTVAVDWAHARYGDSARAASALFPFLLVADGLPFLIWYLLFRPFLHSLVSPPAHAPDAGGGEGA